MSLRLHEAEVLTEVEPSWRRRSVSGLGLIGPFGAKARSARVTWSVHVVLEWPLPAKEKEKT